MKVKLIDILTIWTTWLVLYVHAKPPPPQPSLTFTLLMNSTTKSHSSEDEQNYSELLTQIRYAVQSQTDTCHGLPMVSGPKPDPEFLLVNFQTAEKRIQVAFLRSDFSMQGYSDHYKGFCRYRIFTNSNPRVKSYLCGTQIPRANSDVINNIGYENSYIQIEKKAGVERLKFGVGLVKMWSRIRQIYGKSMIEDRSYEKNEAELFLVLNQIVIDATRFKYIENNVKVNILGEYVPDKRVVSLEDNWSEVSEFIAKQMDASVSFEMPKGMIDDKGKIWKLDSVNNLKSKYVSLLNYIFDCKVKNTII